MTIINTLTIRNILFIIFLFSSVTLYGVEYQVDKNKKNEVKFISDAPIEDFEGVTDKIAGYLYWEGEDLSLNSQVYFEVDLNSLDTGIGLRNRHMREDYLNTEKFPYTHFKGKIIEANKIKDEEFTVKVTGKIFIHGVEKELQTEGSMIKLNESYRIQTDFIVKLSDFNIEIPSLMFLKINENMVVQLDFYVGKVENN